MMRDYTLFSFRVLSFFYMPDRLLFFGLKRGRAQQTTIYYRKKTLIFKPCISIRNN